MTPLPLRRQDRRRRLPRLRHRAPGAAGDLRAADARGGAAHREVIYASGVAELICAVGLLHPRTRRLAGLASAAVLVGVFPGNIKMAVDAMKTRNQTYKAVSPRPAAAAAPDDPRGAEGGPRELTVRCGQSDAYDDVGPVAGRGDELGVGLVGDGGPPLGEVARLAVAGVPLDQPLERVGLVGLDEPHLVEERVDVRPAGCVVQQVVALGDDQLVLRAYGDRARDRQLPGPVERRCVDGLDRTRSATGAAGRGSRRRRRSPARPCDGSARAGRARRRAGGSRPSAPRPPRRRTGARAARRAWTCPAPGAPQMPSTTRPVADIACARWKRSSSKATRAAASTAEAHEHSTAGKPPRP